ncbi:PREDICTED: eIF-2-alpha kinase activator GCN1-like [Ipomoea nil]|uniref:eIF-2-alpha kinase activator GCN1-like n=1 Tax=Ipomoea nil TaxID=35883 RepID=UPI0009013117|nr:PREDICTED: eIF-2-alpha kinase activator GCN1-like [Ipomoea nil]
MVVQSVYFLCFLLICEHAGSTSSNTWFLPPEISATCASYFLPGGLISGSSKLREQAALGLGELIEVTSDQALKEFVIPITGSFIRIIGDRFPWKVKSSILSTLSIIIWKGGLALKPFLPQLQTTFVKCLQDITRTVQSSAAVALGKLSALTTRIDPLVSDLLSALQKLQRQRKLKMRLRWMDFKVMMMTMSLIAKWQMMMRG